MKYTLVVDSQEDYDKWIAEQASKWSQVAGSLKLENGFSKYAPVPAPATPMATTTPTPSDTITISLK